MSERSEYWKEMGFSKSNSGDWFGIDDVAKRMVICAPEEYRKGSRFLVLGPKLKKHHRLSDQRYKSARGALENAIENKFKIYTTATTFSVLRPNRVAEFSRELLPVYLERIRNKFIARRENSSEIIRREETNSTEYREGRSISVILSKKERCPAARAKAIEIHGLDCKVCGTNFNNVYGNIGLGYIHVHHLTPLAGRADEYEVDPAQDLRPVCPNCHAMLHQRKPPFTIEELKAKLSSTGR